MASSPSVSASGFTAILFPTDFSPRSQEEFVTASSLARAGARLIVAHIVEHTGPGAVAEDRLQAARELLGAFHADDPSVRIEHAIRAGSTPEEIVTLARDSGCDLIVLGNKAREGVDRLMMGSVAETVLRRASCAVLCLRSSTPPAPRPKRATDIGGYLQID